MRMLPVVAVTLLACGGPPVHQLAVEPAAELPPPSTRVSPPPGPFNGEVTLTFTTDRPATVYVSTDGSDPRTSSKTRLSGDSPFQVTLTKTAQVAYFASVGGRDEDLHQETWTRAGGPKGTISGTVVVGPMATKHTVAVNRNAEQKKLGKSAQPAEVPFVFENVASGTHRLTAVADLNDDDLLIPFVELTSAMESVTLDLNDPFKASAENVRLFLASSPAELATLQGVLTVPRPETGQVLTLSALSADSFTAITDPQAMLTQLQSGFRTLTVATQTDYPYVVTDLKPGRYVPVPMLTGFGTGGLAMNFLVNPLRPVTLGAGEIGEQNFSFGSVAISGTVTVKAPATPTTGLSYGIVAARASSLSKGIQAVLMPTVFVPSSTAADELVGNYAGTALRENTTFALRVFSNSTPTSNPLAEAFVWALNPFAAQPANVSVQIGTIDVKQDIAVP